MRHVAVWGSLIVLFTVNANSLVALQSPSSDRTEYDTEKADKHQEQVDISGTWIAKATTPMGEIEIVYRLHVEKGKITGSQGLPFGDSPIVDGRLTGDSFQFTVEMDSFGDIQKRQVTGKIVGDSLVLTPAMPAPPPGMSGPGDDPSRPRPSGGSGTGFHIEPVVAVRGTPAPSFRPPSVDYAHLPRISLPALRQIPANGLAQTPPMGWNSWNKFQVHIDDATVRAIADSMVSTGMKDAGYQYVIIDDGWQGTRNVHGFLSPNPNFPDMRALASYVHSKGLKIGIYSSPGPRTCGGFEGSYRHEEQDAQMFADWGMDYLKYDWCSASRVWKDGEMQAVYQKMGDALQRSGRPIVYAICQYGRANVQTWGPQVGGNMWRTTGDIRDQYEAMVKIGFAQSDLARFAGPGHWNDPDMLEVGNGGMSAEEYKTHFSLWAMSAAPLIAGNDLRGMNSVTREILLNREVIAVDQDPLGNAGSLISKQGNVMVWGKSLVSGGYAIAVFNPDTHDVRAIVRWDELGWSGVHSVRDLWAHADLGEMADSYSAVVPAHGVVMIRVH